MDTLADYYCRMYVTFYISKLHSGHKIPERQETFGIMIARRVQRWPKCSRLPGRGATILRRGLDWRGRVTAASS